jgi:hypothetical protein
LRLDYFFLLVLKMQQQQHHQLYADGINMPALIKQAEQIVIDNDRSNYRPFLEVIEKYASETKCVIVGKNCDQLLINEPFNKDNFAYEVYTESPNEWCNELSVRLQQVDSPYVEKVTDDAGKKRFVLQLKLDREQSSIWINGRCLVTADRFYEFKGVDIIKHLGRRRLKGLFTDFVLTCASEYYQMIGIIRKIYNPMLLSQLPANWVTLKQLAAGMNQYIKETTDGRVGGRDDGDNLLADVNIPAAMLKCSTVEDKLVLVGDFAIDSTLTKHKKRLQFACVSPQKLFDRFAANYKIKLLMFPQPNVLIFEPQFKKYTIYIENGDKRISWIDLFNLTEYENIPVKSDNLGVATAILTFRLKLTEYWTLSLLIEKTPSVKPMLEMLLVQIVDIWKHVKDSKIEDLIGVPVGNTVDARVFRSIQFKKNQYVIE